MPESIHDGHRERLKERFLENGLDALDDHEALELLLYFAIPRKDTNPEGHRLIGEFGSLSGALDAQYQDLLKVEGIGPQSALLLKLIPELSRRYGLDRLGKRPMLNTGAKAGEYVHALFIGKSAEALYLLCLDSRCALKKAVLLQEGTQDEVAVYPRLVVQQALKFSAKNVILAHNHPSGSLKPSRADIEVTQKVLLALRPVGITLLDHIIAGHDGFFSFVQNAVFERGEQPDKALYAAEEEE